jgi:hypothetical protein
MKKTLLLSTFILLSVTALIAQEDATLPKLEFKSFNIAGGGVVEAMPVASGSLNMKILYKNVSDAPLKVRERVNVALSQGRFKGAMDRIKVTVFDMDGREMCKQFVYYNDFVLLTDKDGQSFIELNFNTQGCGKKPYENVGSINVVYY